MKRTVTREMAVHFVYAYPFGGLSLDELLEQCGQADYYERAAEEDKLFASPPDETETAYLRRVLEGVVSHMPELDDAIEKLSVGWRLERISRMAAAILRVALFELVYLPEIPEKVSINEAVEIAKKYEPVEVVSYINGLLGSFVRRETPNVEAPTEPNPEPDNDLIREDGPEPTGEEDKAQEAEPSEIDPPPQAEPSGESQ